MSEQHLAAAESPASSFDRNYFLFRRLHSLTGLVPVGAFLFIHLLTNASILAPGERGKVFQESVERIHSLGWLLRPVEIFGIFLPLLFHSLMGFQIWFSSAPNTMQYRYGGNVRYSLQRWTGVIAFFFILYHLWQMHWLGSWAGGGQFAVQSETGAPTAAISAAAAIQSSWWIAPVYALGISASVFHFANGIWTSLITWGITIRPRSQKVAGYICAVFGVVLGLVGLGALSGFRSYEIGGKAAKSGAQTAATGAASLPSRSGQDR